MQRKHNIILSLGSNLGDKVANIDKALTLLKEVVVTMKVSSLYESEAWGFEADDFINQAAWVKSDLTPKEFLVLTQDIEKQVGRKEKNENGYSSRLIDIDILFYDKIQIQEEHLKIPHPHICERRFVLMPLVELIPNFVHPIKNNSVKVLLENCVDTGKVSLLN